jgi:hypothetical protein
MRLIRRVAVGELAMPLLITERGRLNVEFREPTGKGRTNLHRTARRGHEQRHAPRGLAMALLTPASKAIAGVPS